MKMCGEHGDATSTHSESCCGDTVCGSVDTKLEGELAWAVVYRACLIGSSALSIDLQSSPLCALAAPYRPDIMSMAWDSRDEDPRSCTP